MFSDPINITGLVVLAVGVLGVISFLLHDLYEDLNDDE